MFNFARFLSFLVRRKATTIFVMGCPRSWYLPIDRVLGNLVISCTTTRPVCIVFRKFQPPLHPHTRFFIKHPQFAFFAQVTDQVRLEGHGVTELVSTSVQEPPGETWLPLAPTGRPTVSGGSGGSMARHYPMGNADLDPGAAAGLIAQQAMDEARLGLGSTSEGVTPSLSGKGGKGHQHQQRQHKKQASSSWCCICSEDAALQCEQCEAENGQEDEPELFCARCFKEVHGGDPEMEAHRPQAVSRGGAASGERDFGAGGYKSRG